MTVRLVSAGLAWLVFTTCAAAAPPEGQTRTESWIGWAWLGNAGDLPLRVHVTRSDERIEATLDSPAHRAFGMPLEAREWSEAGMRLDGKSRTGSAISITGRRTDTTVEGTIRWADYEGTFELMLSPRPLGDVALETYADAAGSYERSPGDVIELRARPWGELLYRELRSGRVRTLLPLARDHFFIGSAIYLPRPVDSEIRLMRDRSGTVTALTEIGTDGTVRIARKLELVEEPLSFTSGDVTLAGAVLRRKDHRCGPAVVILGGSSWETLADVAFHAHSLAVLGFAVLSFDRRGFGKSEGQRIVPFATTAADAVAAVDVLRKRRDVDATRIGILGTSRGGWQAPLAASMSDHVSFLVLLVPPAVTPAEQETRSRLDQMKRDGFDSAERALARELLTETWKWVRKGDNWTTYSGLRQKAVDAGLPEYVLESDSPDPAEWAWGRSNMFFDPCPALAKVSVPVLAIFGEKDLYVAEPENRAKLSLCIGPRARLTVHTIRGAGHDLAVPNGLPVHRQTGRGDEGFSVIADWAAPIVDGARQSSCDEQPCHRETEQAGDEASGHGCDDVERAVLKPAPAAERAGRLEVEPVAGRG